MFDLSSFEWMKSVRIHSAARRAVIFTAAAAVCWVPPLCVEVNDIKKPYLSSWQALKTNWGWGTKLPLAVSVAVSTPFQSNVVHY